MEAASKFFSHFETFIYCKINEKNPQQNFNEIFSL